MFSTRSPNGFSLPLLKSGIQKGIRFNNFEDAVYCFREFYNTISQTSNLKLKKALTTNLVNRISIIISEDIGIANHVLGTEDFVSKIKSHSLTGEEILKFFKTVCNARKSRLISFLKTRFALPPYYCNTQHQLLESKYPRSELIHPHQDPDHLLALLLQSLRTKSITACFELLSALFVVIVMKKNGRKQRKVTYKIWNFLLDEAEHVKSLRSFFYHCGNEQKFVFLYHAILVYLGTNIPIAGDGVITEEDLALNNDFKKTLAPEVFDHHTNGKLSSDIFVDNCRKCKEEAVFPNIEEYRAFYFEFKEIMHQEALSKKSTKRPLEEDFNITNKNKKVKTVCEITDDFSWEKDVISDLVLDNMMQAQLRTGQHKKFVFIDSDEKFVYKGPFTRHEIAHAIAHINAVFDLETRVNGTSIMLKHNAVFRSDERFYLQFDCMHYKSSVCVKRVSSFEDVTIKKCNLKCSEMKRKLTVDQIESAIIHLIARRILNIGDSGLHNMMYCGSKIYGIDADEHASYNIPIEDITAFNFCKKPGVYFGKNHSALFKKCLAKFTQESG